MKRNALLIGGFVIIALALIVAAILWLSGNSLFKKNIQAMIYYRGNVSGLYVGAPVTFRGVGVGQVDGILAEVDSKTLDARVAVQVRLQPAALTFSDDHPDTNLDLPTLVQRDLRARLVAQSFVTGQKSIELDFVPNTPSTLLGDGTRPEIPALAERFGALIEQVADLPLGDTVRELRGAVGEMSKTLITVQKTLDGAQSQLDAAGKVVLQTGEQSRETLKVAADAIRSVQASTTATLNAVTQLADASRNTVTGAQPELQRTLAGAREAAESAKLAMNRVAEMTAPNAPLRGDLDAAVRDLAQAARGLRDWSELLEEKPNAIIFGNKRE